jgi:peptidoglycan/xylan/chitin deacetylase (PgdA/CDA1 family)
MSSARFAALGAGAGAVGFACYHAAAPTSQLYGPTVCRVPGAGRRVALTYDDGPNPGATEEILELLERHGARATFFVIGSFAELEADLVRAIAARGHAVGNHTWSHPSLPTTSDASLRDELARTRAVVEAAGVEFSEIEGGRLMRPPYGRRRPGTLRTLREEGYAPVMWSLTCYDWRRTVTARAIARRAGRAGDGDIVLLHDGSDRGIGADRSKTVAATEAVLDRLGAEGYAFATVPELVATGESNSASAK